VLHKSTNNAGAVTIASRVRRIEISARLGMNEWGGPRAYTIFMGTRLVRVGRMRPNVGGLRGDPQGIDRGMSL
ncbi:MAG TPA: hypothetical protein VKE53_13010, partial [Pseudolabrys sp.]|nr:hypothetical protein [Pseudolabrys sp.]